MRRGVDRSAGRARRVPVTAGGFCARVMVADGRATQWVLKVLTGILVPVQREQEDPTGRREHQDKDLGMPANEPPAGSSDG